MRTDVRHACDQAVGRLRGTGARAAVRDTLLASSEYAPEQMACVVQADSLPPTTRGDFLQTVPLDSGWSWHPFEPVDNPTYGIQRDSVQCEVTPLAGHRSQVGRGARRYVVSLHIFCYPN